jgi:hypothetical protein
MTVLLVFPCIWTLNNYLYLGAPFKGFTNARAWYHGAQPVNLIDALEIVYHKSIRDLGWIVPVLVVMGIALHFFDAVKRRIDAKRLLYILITCIFWAGVMAYAMARGTALYDRFLLFAFILALPFSALPLTRLILFLRQRKQRYGQHIAIASILLVITLVVSVFYKPHIYTYKKLHRRHTPFFVTLWRPAEIENVAGWVKNSSYREGPFLLTDIEGQSSYFSLYLPEAGAHRLVVRRYDQDTAIQEFLTTQKPSLLITCDYDNEVLSRIEKLLGRNVDKGMLVYKENIIKVYDIRSVVKSMHF